MTSGGRTRTTSTRLAQDRLDVARVAVVGELAARASDGSTSSSRTTRPSAFETDLLRDDEDVAVLEAAGTLGRGGQRDEVVALLDLREPLERDDLSSPVTRRPVTRRPACAL